MANRQSRRGVLLIATGVVIAADWLTKVVASTALDNRSIELGSVMTLRLSHNAGVAFGMGDRLPGAAVIGLTAAVTVGLAFAALRGMFPSAAAAGAILGGAVANLGDRVIGGSVTDFLDLGWWPSFNLADVSLTLGCLAMLLLSWRSPAPAPF
jgi:signal peptidase II